MDHFKILKRAFETTWRYKALWVFGILVALTAGSSGSSGANAGGGGDGGSLPGGGFDISPELVTALIVIGILILIFFLALGLLSVIARYLGENALIRMVDEYEETGEHLSVKEGFRRGWSRSAFQLFLLELVVTIPLVIAFILLFIATGLPLFGWALESRVAGVIGTVVTIGAFFIVLLLAIVVGTVVELLKHFFRRELVLQERGLFEAIREGYQLVRRHLGDVALMWLIMVGVGIGWAIVSFIVALIFVLVGILVGGLPGVAVGGILSLFMDGPWPWIIGGVVALPIFILVVALPNLFIQGIFETFKSTTWTLTYRELLALGALDADIDLPPEDDMALEEIEGEDEEFLEPLPPIEEA